MDFERLEYRNGDPWDVNHAWEVLYWNACYDAEFHWCAAGRTVIRLYHQGALCYTGNIQQSEKADGICQWWVEQGELAPGAHLTDVRPQRIA